MILPPDTKNRWEDCNVIAQANLLAYNQVREHDEMNELRLIARVKMTD